MTETLPTTEDRAKFFLGLSPYDDEYLIDETIKLVRRLLARKDLGREEVHGLAVLLLGLARVPARSPGLSVALRIDLYFLEGSELRNLARRRRDPH